MALGYATLADFPPKQAQSEPKQQEVARRIKAVAPHMPVWGGTDWDLLLCDTPTNLKNTNATCLMNFDAEMRAHPEQLLHCGGQLVTRTHGGAGRAIHDWGNNGTRKAYAAAFRTWRDSGYIDGIFWDGLQHRFNRAIDASQDYPTADGRTLAKCSSDDILAFHAGEVQMVKEGREAIGWENVTICNDGVGLGNWTFAANDSDASLAGKPMCSAANFEFYTGEPMDVLGIYRMGRWSDTVSPYLAAIRGLAGRGEFARHLAGFLVAAGRHHYFLEYHTYNCDQSNGKPPFTGSQLAYNENYRKALGEPSPTEIHSISVGSAENNEIIRETIEGCGCLVGDGMTAEGKPAPAGPSNDPLAGSCMEFDHDCSKCQAAQDHRCKGCPDGKASHACPWCGQQCVFLKGIDKGALPAKTGGHNCLPHKGVGFPEPWINASDTCTDCKSTGECAPTPAPPPAANSYVSAPSTNTTSLWLGTTNFMPAAGLVHNLTAGTSVCECVLTRKFASGTVAYYNGTSWRVGTSKAGSVASSQASCVLWTDNTTLETAGGCTEARAFLGLKTDDQARVAQAYPKCTCANASLCWPLARPRPKKTVRVVSDCGGPRSRSIVTGMASTGQGLQRSHDRPATSCWSPPTAPSASTPIQTSQAGCAGHNRSFLCYAHAHGARVLATVLPGGHGSFNIAPPLNYSLLLVNASAIERMAKRLAAAVTAA